MRNVVHHQKAGQCLVPLPIGEIGGHDPDDLRTRILLSVVEVEYRAATYAVDSDTIEEVRIIAGVERANGTLEKAESVWGNRWLSAPPERRPRLLLHVARKQRKHVRWNLHPSFR